MTSTKLRIPLIDCIRGFALVLMIIYHFCYDLTYFHLLSASLNAEPNWLWFRVIIMTLFTGTMGASLFLAKTQFLDKAHIKRLTKIGLCALLISIGTFFFFKNEWVYFGILHLIFVMSFLGPLWTRFPGISGVIGVILILIPHYYRNFWFIRFPWIITGLSPVKPLTVDFAPLFPWAGVILVGIYLGSLVSKRTFKIFLKDNRALSFLGKRSLVIYMAHQFILFPIAWALSLAF
jgi:uncharacterized membrane protein